MIRTKVSQIAFLTLFPLADDGLIDESDLREVMKACMVENGMEFDEKEVSDLANALFEDAVQVGVHAHARINNFVLKFRGGFFGVKRHVYM